MCEYPVQDLELRFNLQYGPMEADLTIYFIITISQVIHTLHTYFAIPLMSK